jgi:hypothetical protein
LIIVTNNEKVMKELDTSCTKEYIQGTYGEVLITVRDRIHSGHKLLTHPLSGSVKPNETPYKSVIISKEVERLDTDSLLIIEDSIRMYEQFMKNPTRFGNTNQEQVLEDFREVDFRLLMGALKSASIE